MYDITSFEGWEFAMEIPYIKNKEIHIDGLKKSVSLSLTETIIPEIIKSCRDESEFLRPDRERQIVSIIGTPNPDISALAQAGNFPGMQQSGFQKKTVHIENAAGFQAIKILDGAHKIYDCGTAINTQRLIAQAL